MYTAICSIKPNKLDNQALAFSIHPRKGAESLTQLAHWRIFTPRVRWTTTRTCIYTLREWAKQGNAVEPRTRRIKDFSPTTPVSTSQPNTRTTTWTFYCIYRGSFDRRQSTDASRKGRCSVYRQVGAKLNTLIIAVRQIPSRDWSQALFRSLKLASQTNNVSDLLTKVRLGYLQY
jgi:hypothetical protein